MHHAGTLADLAEIGEVADLFAHAVSGRGVAQDDGQQFAVAQGLDGGGLALAVDLVEAGRAGVLHGALGALGRAAHRWSSSEKTRPQNAQEGVCSAA